MPFGFCPGKPASVHATFAHQDAPHLSGSLAASPQEDPLSTSNGSVTRVGGLAVHKRSGLVGAVNAHPQVMLRPHRLSWDEFELWRQQPLPPTDAVVLEATTNAWPLYDQSVPFVAVGVVANPLLIKWISSANIKTDGHATLKLARLLAASMIPTVWAPPNRSASCAPPSRIAAA